MEKNTIRKSDMLQNWFWIFEMFLQEQRSLGFFSQIIRWDYITGISGLQINYFLFLCYFFFDKWFFKFVNWKLNHHPNGLLFWDWLLKAETNNWFNLIWILFIQLLINYLFICFTYRIIKWGKSFAWSFCVV